MTNVETLIGNAKKLGHTTQTTAVAIELCTGRVALSICCWCAEKECDTESFEDYRVAGGDCQCCAYSGVDTLVCVVK